MPHIFIQVMYKNKKNHPILSISFRRPNIKQYTDSNRGGGGSQNQKEHHIILTKYEAVHPTAVSGNNFSSGMLII